MPEQFLMVLPIIEHHVENSLIPQRAYDGYVNATAICKATGKLFADYYRLKTTEAFLSELSHDMGIPISDLVQIIKGGEISFQGTWVHPQVAINLGQWASPKFAVLVSKWVVEWLSGNSSSNSRLPYHIRRYLINRGKIPPTHFSMLDQMTLKLLAPLEEKGYLLPDKLMPDISLGKMFSKVLRQEGHIPESFPTYEHVFDDGKRPPVRARMYPNELMTFFNYKINEWIKNSASKYFLTRDKNALIPVNNLIVDLSISNERKTEIDDKLRIALNRK